MHIIKKIKVSNTKENQEKGESIKTDKIKWLNEWEKNLQSS